MSETSKDKKDEKWNEMEEKKNGGASRKGEYAERKEILYSVEDIPPWYLCILLGFQVVWQRVYKPRTCILLTFELAKHYLTAIGGLIAVPILLAPHFCIDEDTVAVSQLIGTIFFVSGLATLLQTTFGVRLPIVQGGTFTFVAPTIAIMTQSKWACPYVEARKDNGTISLADLPEIGSDEHQEMWQQRIREIQGAIMVSAIFQIVIGFSGLMGFILRFIWPLAITPTIALIGLSLFKTGSDLASKQWWIAIMTMLLIGIFSQYLRNINVPCFTVTRRGGCSKMSMPIFSLFPVILAMIIAWIICLILTEAGALTDVSTKWGYAARTDANSDVLHEAKWFRFPYPGQWGLPTVSVSSVFGMLAGVLASMVESVGDYYACARLSGAPPPPVHAINRGIGIEGIGCILAGAWGSGNGTTSYSENVGVIGVTKVGSRRVVQVGGLIMLVLGCLGKFGALFATIPDPIIGGMFMITFGMVTAVGLSNLQYVDLNSVRNIFILGVSMFFGLSLPVWMQGNTDAIDTGSDIADQIFSVLVSTSMFVGVLVGFVLDNTIPGTDAERGIKSWRKLENQSTEDSRRGREIYSLPLIQGYIDRIAITKYIPFCPGFDKFDRLTRRDEETGNEGRRENEGFDNLAADVRGNIVAEEGGEIVTRI